MIQRANLADGSDVRTLVEDFAQDDYFVDLVLDVERGKMYWGNQSLGKIQRANLDGSNVEDLVTDVQLYGLTLDPRPIPEPGGVVICLSAAAALLRRRALLSSQA